MGLQPFKTRFSSADDQERRLSKSAMSGRGIEKAVILAAGLGTRMRKADGAAPLDPEQAAAADTGVKAMIPIGRPFLDYVISALADSGIRDICLVIGPAHDAIRDYYASISPRRVRVRFAVQPRPLGTADAVLAAEDFAAGEDFLVVNSDNYYPVTAYAALRALDGPGLAVFDREILVARANIPPARIASFALLIIDSDGFLQRIIEKPDAETMASLAGPPFVSMNCWRFSPTIFEACRRVPLSSRGELELPQAVANAIAEQGERFRAVPCQEGVLDLSTRADIALVAERLRDVEVRL
jgi:glucose-1-phosphate thymidylyltransferase